MDQAELLEFQTRVMIFTTEGSLIHLCIENLQEKLLNQKHEAVTITEADSL